MKKGKTLLAVVVAGAWLAGSVALIAQGQSSQTLNGVVSNTHCGLKHSTANATEGSCVNMCVKNNNASYALVSGGKLIKLEGMTAELTKLAGQSAKLTGQVAGDLMRVEKVEAGK